MQTAPCSVLITAANRGLGLEFVRQLLALPTPPKHVFATCRDPENAMELQEMATSNLALKVMKLDVSKPEMLPDIYDAVAKIVKGDGLNMLINNAGVMTVRSLETVTEQGLMDILKVNTVSPILITKAFLPLLKQAASKSHNTKLSYDRAMVVNISGSFGSISGNHSGGFYGTRISKAALNMATNCLSIDLKQHGILAMPIHPGWVQTEMGLSVRSVVEAGPVPITPAESISGMLALFAAARENHAGQFYDYRGNRIEW